MTVDLFPCFREIQGATLCNLFFSYLQAAYMSKGAYVRGVYIWRYILDFMVCQCRSFSAPFDAITVRWKTCISTAFSKDLLVMSFFINFIKNQIKILSKQWVNSYNLSNLLSHLWYKAEVLYTLALQNVSSKLQRGSRK